MMQGLWSWLGMTSVMTPVRWWWLWRYRQLGRLLGIGGRNPCRGRRRRPRRGRGGGLCRLEPRPSTADDEPCGETSVIHHDDIVDLNHDLVGVIGVVVQKTHRPTVAGSAQSRRCRVRWVCPTYEESNDEEYRGHTSKPPPRLFRRDPHRCHLLAPYPHPVFRVMPAHTYYCIMQ